jgi:hypothetical protein
MKPEDDKKDAGLEPASRTNTDPAPARPTGQQTALLRSKEIEAEAKIREKEIDADIRKQELALEAKRIDNESKKIDADDHDKARDDRRSTIKTVLLWITGITGTVGTLILIGFALYYNRAFVFSGFGIEASTHDVQSQGDEPGTSKAPEEPKTE